MPVERARVEVAYAGPAGQWVLRVEVPVGTSLRGVLERARVADRLSSEELSRSSFGVFGVLRELDALVADGERVEIYRPLADDPKLIRRRRGLRSRPRRA